MYGYFKSVTFLRTSGRAQGCDYRIFIRIPHPNDRQPRGKFAILIKMRGLTRGALPAVWLLSANDLAMLALAAVAH